ncbi:MAG: hypothetical protein NT062_17415 [Proteobacteria bacterium]|nr:hypothetical protein [Pseudomonadota bacterium]
MSDIGVEIDDEVRDALRTLIAETGAISARIVIEGAPADDAAEAARTGVPARTVVLGEYLHIELSTQPDKTTDLEAACDRVTRQLRAIRRRWEATHLPEIVVGATVNPPQDRIVERITSYLQALANVDRATNAFLILKGKLVASAHPPQEVEKSRWPFLARRVFGAHAPHSSHGEVVDPDAYACSFWYDAGLVVLLAEPYAVDFVRHRCRQVARELAHLLPMLEPDPSAPAMLRNRPPTGPT